MVLCVQNRSLRGVTPDLAAQNYPILVHHPCLWSSGLTQMYTRGHHSKKDMVRLPLLPPPALLLDFCTRDSRSQFIIRNYHCIVFVICRSSALLESSSDSEFSLNTMHKKCTKHRHETLSDKGSMREIPCHEFSLAMNIVESESFRPTRYSKQLVGT